MIILKMVMNFIKNLFVWFCMGSKRKDLLEKLTGIDMVNEGGHEVSYQNMRLSLASLPDNVLALMKKEKVKVVFGTDDTLLDGEEYAGLFMSDRNKIYVLDDGGLFGDWGWQANTLIHEVGHFVDFCVGKGYFLSLADEQFHVIASREGHYYDIKVNGSYYRSNVKEYFAQSFAEYCTLPTYKLNCPETAEYIEYVIEII